ncbi:hypothetical protein CRUP_021294 [Coryphaenoides rupestris]|nr:hypothetical protein CRUP_021294 [Coryphaenoides rupestris]
MTQRSSMVGSLSLEEALEVQQILTRGVDQPGEEDEGGGGGGLTALELLQQEERRIVTFSSQLDAMLGGGVPLGRTSELCIDVQIPESFGGLGGQAVFVGHEGSLHCSLQDHDSEQQEAMKDFTMETILGHIYLMRCHDYVELLAQMHLMPDFLVRNSKVRLLVIDSLAIPFRRHFEDISVRTRLLNGLAQQLIQIASQHSLAVVWTNQMTTQMCSSQWKLVPALGESWGHSATQRLLLHWNGTHRLVSVFKSPNNMEGSVPYRITPQGFRDTHHTSPLASSPFSSLSEGSLSLEEALEVQQILTRGVDQPGEEDGGGGGGLTALELLQQEERRIVTFSSQLDAMLGGGVPLGRTSELCIDVQIPESFGGLGGQAVFVDTEGSLVVQRVMDLAHAAVQHCSLQDHDSEQQEAMKDFTMETILGHIYLMRCHDYVELLAQMHLMSDFLVRNSKVRLLVIDSLAIPFRRHFEDISVRTRLLNGLAQQLIQIASQHSLAVVWTNQMTTQMCSSQWKLVPALGESWGHSATQRLLLHWNGTHRLVSVFKSPNNMEGSVPYRITPQGFRDTHHTSPLASSPFSSLSGIKQVSGSLSGSKRPRIQEGQ